MIISNDYNTIEIKKSISRDHIKEVFKLMAWLWPPDTKVLELLPKPEDKLRSLYLGWMRPESVLQSVVRHSLYCDEILVKNPFVNDHKRSYKIFNLSGSVFKDIEIYPYGNQPAFRNLFSVIDTFSVFGKLNNKEKSRAGLILDFYSGTPTKTTTFTEAISEEQLRSFSESAFDFANAQGEQAYLEKSLARGNLDLTKYCGIDNIMGLVSDGQITFGGNGRPQDYIIKGLMDNLGNQSYFNPESYHLIFH